MKNGDFFILTTAKFTHLIGSEKHLKQLFTAQTLEKNIDELSQELESKDDHGTIALFLIFKDSLTQTHAVPVEPLPESDVPAPKTSQPSLMSQLKSRLSQLHEGLDFLTYHSP